MKGRRIGAAAWGLVLSGSLVSCYGEDSTGAAESAAEAFLEFILFIALLAMIMVIVWALILAGGVAAILAGIRRLSQRDRRPPPPVSATPAPSDPDPATHAGGPPTEPLPGAPALPQETEPRRDVPDTFGIALIVFGAVLVITAGPFVLNADGFSPGVGISVPLPLLIGAGVLIAFAIRRRRR